MFKKLILLSFIISIYIYPQGESAISTLTLPLSARSIGAGGTGTANTQSDPFGYWSNPAYLGYTSSNSFVTGGFYPGVTKWAKTDDNTINSYSISAGYNLQKLFNGLPVSIGAAYSKWQFNYGDMWGINYGAKDFYAAYSIGIGYHSLVNVSAGLTIKDVHSVLVDFPELKSETSVTAVDYGLLINLPLNNFFKKPLKFNINKSSILTTINYNIGYSIQNVGDEVHFADPNQKDPIPRTAKLAHNINIGFLLNSDKIDLELFNFSYSLDAVDNIVQKKWAADFSRVDISYGGMFGSIKPIKNLFLGKSDSEIIVRKGLELGFGEILSLSWGGFNGGYIANGTTSGYGLKLKGLLKITDMLFPDTIISQLVDKVDIQYNYSTYYKDSPLETNFKSIAVTISGF